MLHFWLKTNSTDNYSWSEARKIFESAANNLSRYPKNPIVRGKYIKCKKQYKTLVKETKRAFCENILKKIQQMEDENSKEFWNLVRELGSKKDKNLSDNIDPEIWYVWFKKLNNANDTWSDDTYRPIIRNMRDFVPQFVKMLDKPIDVDEVKKAALKLKNGKSVGIDLISNEMINSSRPRALSCGLLTCSHAVICWAPVLFPEQKTVKAKFHAHYKKLIFLKKL